MIYFTLFGIGLLCGMIWERIWFDRYIHTKAKRDNRTAICVDGKFYMVMPESEYVSMRIEELKK